MASFRRGRDEYELIHPFPKPADTERFIPYQPHHSSAGGIANGSYYDHSAAPRTPRQKARFFGLGWWIVEIVALNVSIASFIAIVIVLRIYNGHPVSDIGLPTGLTLNALIAALATVSRAALMVAVPATLMQELWLFYAKEAKKAVCSSRLNHLDIFDSASRGTWGSLVLLFRLHYRRIFASLAALVTVLSLLFGTFVQQVIVYDNLPLNSDSSLAPGNIPRSEAWTQFVGAPAETTTAGSSYGPPLPFVAAFYDGVLRGGIAPPLAHCPSGNCTWPSTPSMAICGGCSPSEPTKVFCYDDEDMYYCNYTLPSGSVAQLWNFDKYSAGDGVPGFQVLSSPTGYHYNLLKGDRAYVANFDLMGAPYGMFDGLYMNNNKLNASECALWMCVQTYDTKTMSGTQVQTVTYQMSDVNARGILFPLYSEPGGVVEETAIFPPVPSTYDPNGVTNFTADRLAVQALTTFFDSVITGTVWMNLEGNVFSNYLVQGIWNGTTDIDAWINNVAASITGVVRTSNQTLRPEYNGTAYALSVRVRWYWLLLPLTLVALSILILLAAIIRTARSPVQAWKGSPLTFLLFGVDDAVREASYGQGIKHKGFQKAVGKRKVQLVEQGGTLWKFKSA